MHCEPANIRTIRVDPLSSSVGGTAAAGRSSVGQRQEGVHCTPSDPLNLPKRRLFRTTSNRRRPARRKSDGITLPRRLQPITTSVRCQTLPDEPMTASVQRFDRGLPPKTGMPKVSRRIRAEKLPCAMESSANPNALEPVIAKPKNSTRSQIAVSICWMLGFMGTPSVPHRRSACRTDVSGLVFFCHVIPATPIRQRRTADKAPFWKRRINEQDANNRRRRTCIAYHPPIKQKGALEAPFGLPLHQHGQELLT